MNSHFLTTVIIQIFKYFSPAPSTNEKSRCCSTTSAVTLAYLFYSHNYFIPTGGGGVDIVMYIPE